MLVVLSCHANHAPVWTPYPRTGFEDRTKPVVWSKFSSAWLSLALPTENPLMLCSPACVDNIIIALRGIAPAAFSHVWEGRGGVTCTNAAELMDKGHFNSLIMTIVMCLLTLVMICGWKKSEPCGAHVVASKLTSKGKQRNASHSRETLQLIPSWSSCVCSTAQSAVLFNNAGSSPLNDYWTSLKVKANDFVWSG